MPAGTLTKPKIKKIQKTNFKDLVVSPYFPRFSASSPRNSAKTEEVLDGIFGNQTEEALKEFQSDNKLTADGVFGKGTANYLDSNCDSIKSREEWEEKKPETEEKEEQNFTTQNPIQKEIDIEGKDFSKNPNVQVLDDWINQRINDQVKDNKELSEILRKTILNSKGPTEALSAVTVLSLAGLYGLTDNIFSSIGSGVIDLRKRLELVVTGKKEKEFFFKIYEDKDGNKTAKKEKHNPNKETIIIIHGFKSEPTDWVKEIAQSYNNGNREILLLNWKEVVDLPLTSYDIAVESVDDIKNILVQRLKDWGIEKNKTIFVSHSLGTILSGELSQKLGKVNKLVILDPATGTGRNNNFFQNKANEIICISTWGSDLSNEKFLNYCNQSYLIKSQYFKAPVLGKHSLAHDIYRQILSTNTLYNNIISFNSPPTHTKQSAKVEDDRIIKVDGFLNAENLISKELNYLEMKRNNTDIFLGSSIDNEFTCEENVCEFYGWKGDDEYYQEKFKPDFVIMDFGKRNEKDKLYIKKGFNEISSAYGKLSGYDLGTQIQIRYPNSERKIFLEGVGEDEVKEWLQILNNELPESYKKEYTEDDLPILKERNPIQIE